MRKSEVLCLCLHTAALGVKTSETACGFQNGVSSPGLILVGSFESHEAGQLCFFFTDTRTGVVAKATSYVSSFATARLSYVTRSQQTWRADRDNQFYSQVRGAVTSARCCSLLVFPTCSRPSKGPDEGVHFVRLCNS